MTYRGGPIGQVVLPERVRDGLGIRPGGEVTVEGDCDSIRIRKVQRPPGSGPRAQGGLSYADAFCVATARRHRAALYTGDPEILHFDDAGVDVVDLTRRP